MCHAGVCLPDVRQHAGVGGYCGVVGEGENVIAVMYFMGLLALWNSMTF